MVAVAGEVCDGRGGEAAPPGRALAEGPELVRLMGDDPDGITLDDEAGETRSRARGRDAEPSRRARGHPARTA